MKRQTVQNLIVVILFGIALIVPFWMTDFLGGKISDTENRRLAPFPISVDMEHGTVHASTNGVEQWINDNIGFREAFVKIYTIVKNKILGLSTSPHVMTGTDGWYFYTPDNNIEVATGRYPLTEEDLMKIAEYQQNISDYYNSLGKEYILMLTPSKASVYSEYLPMQDEVVSYTPVDIVTDYLKEHTDVVVYNSKEALLDAKDEGQLYLKTDSHWNERGSYTVYKGLFEVMKEKGILTGTPIEVSYDQGTMRGEFSAMLGNTDLIPAEAIPVAKWDPLFYQVTEGDQFASAAQIQNDSNPVFKCSVLKNDIVPTEKILQIYGDSQTQIIRKIPCYLAEHFSQVFSYVIRNVSPVVDAIADPDVVVFSCSERLINPLLTVPGNVPVVVDHAPDLPRSDFNQDKGYAGMWLDLCNGQPVSEQGSIHDILFESNGYISLGGWAADFSAMQPLSGLYLQIGNVVLECSYGLPRDDVSACFGTDNLLNTGFSITFPTKYLRQQSAAELQFIQVGADGAHQYAPVQYSVSQ